MFAATQPALTGLHFDPQHKWNQAEDYLEADMRPRSASDAAAQAGYIPSNTQDVLASRGGR